MTIDTAAGIPVSADLLQNYFTRLVNQFFKILPMREDEEESLGVYMRGLQKELLGCQGFVNSLSDNPFYMSLLSILQYLIDTPDCSVSDVRREVFDAINICHKLKSSYESSCGTEDEQ